MKEVQKKYGIIAGVAVVGYMLLFYFIDKSLMLNWKVYWSSLIIYIIGMYVACAEKRKSEGDVLDFQIGLRTAFVTFLLANGIFYAFQYLLFNFGDPTLVDLQKAASIELYKEFMGEEQAKEMIKAMKEDGFGMTIGASISGFVQGAIGGFLLALMVAGILRRE